MSAAHVVQVGPPFVVINMVVPAAIQTLFASVTVIGFAQSHCHRLRGYSFFEDALLVSLFYLSIGGAIQNAIYLKS